MVIGDMKGVPTDDREKFKYWFTNALITIRCTAGCGDSSRSFAIGFDIFAVNSTAFIRNWRTSVSALVTFDTEFGAGPGEPAEARKAAVRLPL